MMDPLHPDELRPGTPEAASGKNKPTAAGSELPATAGANAFPTATDETPPANKLTPEEQMALFEKELKEKDWGHQPC
jgi:hypothetical protein